MDPAAEPKTLSSGHTAAPTTHTTHEAQGIPSQCSGMGTHPVSWAPGASPSPSAEERKVVSSKRPTQPLSSGQPHSYPGWRLGPEESPSPVGSLQGQGPSQAPPVPTPKSCPASWPYLSPQCCMAQTSVHLPARTDGQMRTESPDAMASQAAHLNSWPRST